MTIGRLAGVRNSRGDVAEILTCHRVLTTCKRQAIEGYLARTWGIASSLPMVDPFRCAAPKSASITCSTGLRSLAEEGSQIDGDPAIRVPEDHAGGLVMSGKSLSIVWGSGAGSTVPDGEGEVATVARVETGGSPRRILMSRVPNPPRSAYGKEVSVGVDVPSSPPRSSPGR